MAALTDSWIELEKQFGGRTTLHGTPAELRAQYQAVGEAIAPNAPPKSPAIATKDGDVDGIKYRVYTPHEAAKAGRLPVGIYTHGGGYVMGDLESEDAICRLLAEHGPAIIVSVDYRLAPEHVAPAQLEDSLKVFKWAHKNAASLGGDPYKFFTTGGSAGGGLALSVARSLLADPSTRSQVRGIVAMVPIAVHPDAVPSGYESMYTAYQDNADGAPVIDALTMQQFYEATVVDPKDKSYFAALDAENHQYFPPTYITTCEFDPLRDDGIVMEAALKKAGVRVKRDHYKGLPHYFWIFPGLPEADTFFGNLIGGLKWVLGEM